jgi:hypothetical protein
MAIFSVAREINLSLLDLLAIIADFALRNKISDIDSVKKEELPSCANTTVGSITVKNVNLNAPIANFFN